MEKNKNIAIPIFLFGGLFILAIIGLAIWYFVRRYKGRFSLHGKDKNSRPSSIASSRPESIRHHVAGFGNNNRDGNNNDQNNNNSTNNNSNNNINTNNNLAPNILHTQRNVNERAERTNPFFNNNINGSNINIDQANNTILDTSIHSTHSSYASQPNTLLSQTTTTSSTRESNIPSELWELKTFNNGNSNLRDTSQKQPFVKPFIPDTSSNLFSAKNLSDTDYSTNYDNNNNNNNNDSNNNNDINITNPFSISRRHPTFPNSPTLSTVPSIPLNDIMINTKDTSYVDPNISIGTGTHRRTPSNVDYN